MKRTIVVLFVMLSSCRGERAGGARVQILVNHVGYETSGAKRAVAKWKTWRYWTADFDGATGEGDYFVECTANGRGVRSFPFAIQRNLLERNVVSNVIYYFKG